MANSKIDINDKRWSGSCPWFLRYQDFSGTGNFLLFFDRLSHRINQLMLFNETEIPNLLHFAYLLESKSLRRFKCDKNLSDVALQIADYFSPKTLEREMFMRLYADPEEKKLRRSGMSLRDMQELLKSDEINKASVSRQEKYYRQLFIERLGVLEILLQILPQPNGFHDFVKDVRRFLAEAQIMLDIDAKTFEIKLLEEPLLQKEVINKLMPRLASRYPDRAKELSTAYHDMIGGEKKFDDIFIGAFKTLEELARQITMDNKFEFKRECLRKYFPNLHPTIHDTMIKLAGHRGDEGGHGRDAPEPHEMRYLLFSISNIALLLLDYKR